jgi:transcription elongation factor Elf1
MIPVPRSEMSRPAQPPRDFACPRCGARPHSACETADGLPWADHAERIEVARGSARSADDHSVRRPTEVRYDAPPRIPEVARRRLLPKDYVRVFTCPKCGSGPLAPCVDGDGQARIPNHSARVAVARASLSKRSEATSTTHVWVAGVCPDEPGPGGWAALLQVGGAGCNCTEMPLSRPSRG